MTTSNQIRLVVFDWAGTTIDFGSRAPAISFAKVFAAHGVEVSDEEARRPMGLNKREHLVAMLKDPEIASRWQAVAGKPWTEADVDAMYEEFVPFQLKAIEQTSKLVPGLLDVVKQLRSRGIQIGGTTGYFKAAADAVATNAAKAGFAPDVNVCADDVKQGRPAPWMIYHAMYQLGVFPAVSVVKVGDTVADIKAGLNAGCWSVGVCDSSSLTGLSQQELADLTEVERTQRLTKTTDTFRDAGAHATISTIVDLPDLINELNEQPRLDVLPSFACTE